MTPANDHPGQPPAPARAAGEDNTPTNGADTVSRHDLYQPLQAARILMDLLLDQLQDHDHKRLAQRARKALQQALNTLPRLATTPGERFGNPSQRFIGSSPRATIAIVEDNCDVLDSLVSLLVSEGYRAIAGQSLDALMPHLEPADAPPVDLLIADYQLGPGSNGLDVIHHLRSLFARPVPAIILSGENRPEWLASAHRMNVRHLPKPFRGAQLRAMVADCLYEFARTGTAEG